MIQSKLYAIIKNLDFKILIVEDFKQAQEAYHLISFAKESHYCSLTPIILPDFRARWGDDLRSFYQEFIALLSNLRDFYNTSDAILIAPVSSVLYALPKKELLQSLKIDKNDPIDLSSLKEQLIYYGYECVEIVEMPAEVSFRGDIVDIGITKNDEAQFYRLSFFDIECESIRILDPMTQKSKESHLDVLEIPAALFSLNQEQYHTLKERVENSDLQSFSKDVFSLGFWFLQEWGTEILSHFKAVITPEALDYVKEIFTHDISSPYDWHFFENLPLLESKDGFDDIKIDSKNLTYFLDLHSKKPITILAPTSLSAQEFIDKNLKAIISPFVVNISTPQEYIISLNAYPKTKRKTQPKIAIHELNAGEYVVHKDYGIGIFKGIKQAKTLGCLRDFIEIAYQGEDVLLLPVENLNFIDRYVAGDLSVPMVDRLGRGHFAKMREKIKTKLFEIADAIIKLAAQRKLIEGRKIDVHKEEISIFKEQAGFELTEDQNKSIAEIYRDLSSGEVMDRLLSGDVGFGKTEVALNAIFAVCQNGLQALMLVPTTLLSLQHYHTLKNRLKNLNVAKLDRFVTTKQKHGVLEGLKNGSIDVVVGTHSLFSAEFRNLGLIVIDEEHKFGVKQKESIKALSKNVHLLSLSATPIPRTLNMALSQIKGMSTLTTPPFERQGSKTFVKQKNDALIKEVILREMRRSGQIFYVHNNIAHIPQIKNALLDLLPNLKIAVLHSQISSAKTEEIMLDFANKQYHLLLCTAIVESGIHLPNANSIIVDGADRFGLADLHQLRGRVGRGDKEGYCYFLVDSQEHITPESRKRLLALEKNSFLGSGAMIAHQDLEIRGGGNLLGEAQSGHIKNIGYGLYLKMLEDAIYQLSAKEKMQEDDVELRLQVSAFLSADLIHSETLRLELYRRLSLCKNVNEVYDIELEIKDRFGHFDPQTQNFLILILIKILARNAGYKSISNYKNDVALLRQDGEKQWLKISDEDQLLSEILSFLRNQNHKTPAHSA